MWASIVPDVARRHLKMGTGVSLFVGLAGRRKCFLLGQTMRGREKVPKV
jgi:hypothetical protein